MKKIILLLLFYNVGLMAQTLDFNNQSTIEDYQMLANPSVQTPDVTAFQKVNQIPVSHYTGRANVTIPIYEIKSGGMTVPITLSYNTSGVKVADMPSNVGSNWALNAGGMITKNVRGIDDFTFPYTIYTFFSDDAKSPGGWLINKFPNGSKYSLEGHNDPLPDVYCVNAPGFNTKFIHGGSGNSSISDIIEIESKGSIIKEKLEILYEETYTISGGLEGPPFTTYCRGVSDVNVVALDGVEYDFSYPEILAVNSPSSSLRSISTSTFLTSNSIKLGYMYEKATDKKIEFEYETYKNNFRDYIPQKGKLSSTSFRSIETHKITKISFEEGSVEFRYNLDRLDNTGEKALTDILVKDYKNNIIQHHKLEYSYFQSPINANEPQSKRLRLDKVYRIDLNENTLPGHEFIYENSIHMPPRDSWARDFLGYNNGSYSTTIDNGRPVPKLYYGRRTGTNSTGGYNPAMSPFKSGAIILDSRSSNTPTLVDADGNYSLEANEEACKAYILKQIKYPTGGKLELEYELNTFDAYNEEREGGGLRVKSQKRTDEYGVEIVEDYFYNRGNINRMPRMSSTTFKNGGSSETKVYGLPQGNVELTQGSFVGYKFVEIKNRYDNSKLILNFNGPSNIYPRRVPIEDSQRSRIWQSYGYFTTYIDRDFKSGKLKYEIKYNANGYPVYEKVFDYTTKTFNSYDFIYRNLIATEDVSCITQRGLIDPRCGGFDELITWPIERYLLTSIVTKIFDEHHTGSFKEDQGGLSFYPETTYIQKVKRFEYNEELPLVKKEIEGVFNCEYKGGVQGDCRISEINSGNEYADQEVVVKEYIYPEENSVLYNAGKKSTPVGLTLSNSYNKLKKVDYNYTKDRVTFLSNESITNYGESSESTEIKLRVLATDSKGNILETVDNRGVYNTYLYAYNGNYLVCKIENMKYDDLNSFWKINHNLDIKSSVYFASSDTSINATINEIRQNFPNSFITSYTHKPLVGITSMTDTRGRITTYEYDSFNRLSKIYDNEGYLITENKYNYKN